MEESQPLFGEGFRYVHPVLLSILRAKEGVLLDFPPMVLGPRP